MEEFELKGGADFLKISLEEVYGFPDETSSFGGYDTRSLLSIQADGFSVQSTFYTSTGEIFEFYKQLEECNKTLKGSAYFLSYEENLKFEVQYYINGHVIIKGSFFKHNELLFEIDSDQTYMQSSLQQLKAIYDKYGDMKGIK